MIYKLIESLNKTCEEKNIEVVKVAIYPKLGTFIMNIEKNHKDVLLSWSNFSHRLTVRAYKSQESGIDLPDEDYKEEDLQKFLYGYLTDVGFIKN